MQLLFGSAVGQNVIPYGARPAAPSITCHALADGVAYCCLAYRACLALSLVQFMRTTSSYTSWVPAVVGFMQWAGWRRVGVISSNTNLFSLAAQELNRVMYRAQMETALSVSFISGKFEPSSLKRIAASACRVTIVFAGAHDVIRIASEASAVGMLSEGSAWIALDDDGLLEAGRELHTPTELMRALCGWVSFQPESNTPYAFFDRVHEATRVNFPGVFDAAQSLTKYAANMYDAVLLYATAVGRRPGLSDGRLLMAAAKNVSFDGIRGRVSLDENGDMKETICALNYVADSDGTLSVKIVGSYDAVEQHYIRLTNRSIIWPGNSLTVPVSVVYEAQFNTLWLLLISAATGIIVVVGLVVIIKRRSKHLQHVMPLPSLSRLWKDPSRLSLLAFLVRVNCLQ